MEVVFVMFMKLTKIKIQKIERVKQNFTRFIFRLLHFSY